MLAAAAVAPAAPAPEPPKTPEPTPPPAVSGEPSSGESGFIKRLFGSIFASREEPAAAPLEAPADAPAPEPLFVPPFEPPETLAEPVAPIEDAVLVLIAEPVGPLDRVVHVPPPVVLSHVPESGADTALGGDDFEGFVGRVEMRPTPGVTLDLQYFTEDDLNKDASWFAGLRINLPFSLAELARGRVHPGPVRHR